MPEGLQLVLGADGPNSFTVYNDEKNNQLYACFGLGLFEVVENDSNNFEYRHLLARLYNLGVKVKTLIEHFGFSYPTYKRWGDALKSGDKERIHMAFSGRGQGVRKLRPEILAFVVHDFEHVYERNKYSYSKEIRQDVKDIYNVDLSAECIRPILGKLKKTYLEKQYLSEEEKKSIYKSFLN